MVEAAPPGPKDLPSNDERVSVVTQLLPQDHPLRHLFCGVVQHVFFVDMGMCDPQIVDYLAELLSRLLHGDDFYPFTDASGRRLQNLAEMATDTYLGPTVSTRERQRIVYKHIGDFSLFWTGVYPEGLRRLQALGAADRLTAYLDQGKRSYAIASDLTVPDAQPPAGVLRRLSEMFEYCVYGLNCCRREWDALAEQRPRIRPAG